MGRGTVVVEGGAEDVGGAGVGRTALAAMEVVVAGVEAVVGAAGGSDAAAAPARGSGVDGAGFASVAGTVVVTEVDVTVPDSPPPRRGQTK